MKKRIIIGSFLVTTLVGSLLLVLINHSVPDTSSSANNSTTINSNTTNSPQSSENSYSKPHVSPDAAVSQAREDRIGKEITLEFGQKAQIKRYKPTTLPNDPNSGQWWESSLDTNNTVWNMPAPAKQTTIAVVDTGFALDHEEFAGRFFNNSGEIGTTAVEDPSDPNCTDQSLPLDMACNNVDDNVDGVIDNESGYTEYENPSLYNCTDQSLPLDKSCNRIDDDGNGYIDDVSGWDFVNGDPSPQAGELREANDVNTYHGTMVAGIAAGSGNNSTGIAGIDWNAKILPLQALDDDGHGDSITVGDAIKYAADMGVDVINLSLGTDTPDIIILEAIEYAYNKGVLVVASAGNDGCDCMVWPARYNITLSVGSTQLDGTRSSFSSYGTALDIMAPGSSIISSTYSSSNRISGYAVGSGTSFAAPMISGLASRIKAQQPNISPLQLAAIITEQANKTINGGQHKTSQNGYGLVSFSSVKDRLLNPKTFEYLYSFSYITDGGVFYGDSKDKPPVYACPSSVYGTTPIYKSSKSKLFYSVNQTDLRYATEQGYSNKSELSACVLMPNDIVANARDINLAGETSNQSIKSLLNL